MSNYVDVEGSGENTTKIVYNGGVVVNCAPYSEIRDLTVESTGGVASVFGIYASNDDFMKITNVTVNVSGGTTSSYGVYHSSSPATTLTLTDVVINASGSGTYAYAVMNSGSTNLIMDHVTAMASGTATSVTALRNGSSTSYATVKDSFLSGTAAINISGGLVKVANSELSGMATSLYITCINSYKFNGTAYAALSGSCQ